MLNKIRRNRFFIPAVITFIVFSILCLSVKIFFYFRFDESHLRQIVTEVCKNNLNKAVKFDSIYIDITGDIVLERIKLSLTPDFNDNLNSLVAEKAVLNLKIVPLTKGNILVKGLLIKNPVINLTKQYGKDYKETFKRIFTLNRTTDIINTGFQIDISSATVNYAEIFSDSRLTVKISDMDASADFTEGAVSYKLHGDISPCKTPRLKNGKFRLKGSVNNLNGKNPCTTDNLLKFDNIDLSYSNDYILSYSLADMALNGTVNGSVRIITNPDQIYLWGLIETGNLHLLRNQTNPYPMISGANFDISLDADFSLKEELYRIRKLEITDDELDISIKGEYAGGNQPRLRLVLAPAKIDLADISTYITPFRDIQLSGDLSVSADIDYNSIPGYRQSFKSDIICKDLSITSFNGFKKTEVVKSGEIEAHLGTDALNVLCSLNSTRTDLIFKSTTSISSWTPFRSSTILEGSSQTLQAHVLGTILEHSLDSVFEDALNDSQIGYEERFFLTRPVGQFVNNNDFSMSYTADSILFENTAALNKLRIGCEMRTGILKLTDFSLLGYGATYMLDVAGELNRDYPHIAINAKVKGFDCTRFAQSMGEPGFGGIADMDLTYDLTFYRPSHIFENGHTHLGIRLYNGFIRNTPFQKRLALYLGHNGLNALNTSDINYSNLSLECNQSGDTFYIQPLNLTAPGISLNGNGRFTYVSGLEINLALQALETNTGKGVYIPFSLEGNVLNPQLWLKTRNASGSFSLFDVN